MEEQNNSKIVNIRKIWYALSALMFFAPFVKFSIKSDESFSQWDKTFINWFIKLGYINIILIILAMIFRFTFMSTKNPIYQSIMKWIIIAIIWVLVIWSCLAFFKKNINLTNSEWKAEYDKIFSFIPLYNIYLWYDKHDFEWWNISIKFGIILRSLFSISLIIFQNKYINIVFVLLILICMISAVAWIDFWEKWKNFINNLFQKNPEEIRGYISWSLASLFNKDWLNTNITRQKNYFDFLFKLEDKQIILEYVLFWLISISLIVIWFAYNKYQLLLWLFIIVGRYLIMIINWNHAPHIPILKEITNIFFRNKLIKNE